MKQRWILWSILTAAFLAALIGLLRYRQRRGTQRRTIAPTGSVTDLGQFQGLTEAEAEARRTPRLAQEREQAARQVRRDIWRSSTLSIFNLGLLGLAAAQALLGDPLSALLTIGVLIFNIIITAGQQLYATGRVEMILDQTQPLATAIRDGRIRSVELDDIVVDDVLVAGPGDQFLANGKLLSGRPQVVEMTSITEEGGAQPKEVGNLLQEESYCLRGQAIYQVMELPGKLADQRWTPVQEKAELTPLQRIMARVLRIMLALIVFFLALLVLEMANWPILAFLFEDIYREAASVFFSIAPSGLFFMIVATYALGSARLGELGALIRDSRAVESLAQISVLCFSKTGALTGAEVQLEMIPWENGKPALAESRVRQILGDLAHSARSDNVFLQAIQASLAGSSRPLVESTWFAPVYGWGAVTFSEVGERGTFVIGAPDTLALHIAPQPSGDEAPSEKAADEEGSPQPRDEGTASESKAGNFIRRAQRRLGNLIQSLQEAERKDPGSTASKPQLLFAYAPQPQPLFGAGGERQMPDGLIPLCNLRFVEQTRPEAKEAVEAFTGSGIRVKILSSAAPECVLETAEQVGLARDETDPGTAVSGLQLVQADQRLYTEVTHGRDVFGYLTPWQKGEIVQALRDCEERVAMVGDGADDVLAMERANLSLTMQSSCQAALSLADIVLLEGSFDVLPTILDRGQRIVNGMLDILKINLAQICYVLLLIVAMFIAGRRVFYYHPTQGGVIAFFTVIVPSLGLTFFASSGTLPRQYMRTRMVHFVLPAAVTMTVAALIIDRIFRTSVSDIPYSELAVTHGLVVMGLLLIVFVQPPAPFWVGGDVLSGDWRNTHMAIVLLILFLAATYIPLTQELLRLAPLQSVKDYLIIGVVTIVWAFLLRAIWRTPWLNRYADILSERLEKS